MAIVGTGRSVPSRAIASSDFDDLHGFSIGYLQSVTGVHTRYLRDGENQIDLACEVARKALDAAVAAADARFCERIFMNDMVAPFDTVEVDEALSNKLSASDKAIIYRVRAGIIRRAAHG